MEENIKITFSEDKDTFEPDICENASSTNSYHINYIIFEKSYDIEPHLTSVQEWYTDYIIYYMIYCVCYRKV